MKAPSQDQTVASRVAALPRLPMKDLWALWDQYFPRRPSHHNRDSDPELAPAPQV